MEFTTKSVVVKKFGGYDSLSIEKFPLPQLENNVEIKVHYCGMNFADLYTRQGLMYNKKLPFVLGMECSGVITAIDLKETKFKVGDHVVCYDFNGGMYSDRIRIPASNCYSLPDYVSLEEGASIFVNYLTAYFTILELGNLKRMQNVLIFSCAGGVGYAATQLAKTIDGVKVFGVASEGKEEAALKNGVEKIFSYTDLENKLKNNVPEGFDLILTNQSGPSFTFLQSILKPLGRIVLIGANNLIQNEKKLSKINLFKNWWSTKYVTPESLIVNNRVVAGFHLGTLILANRNKVIEALNEIYTLLKDCKIKPNIHAIMPVEQIVDGTKILELGNLKRMQNVLIFSCAGGVGYAATQLAKTIDGVKVFGVASEGKEEAALKNGVEKIFSYTDLENKLKNNVPEGFDLILTNQSGPSFTYLQSILKPLGRIVLIGANNLIQNEKKLSKINLFKNWWSTKYVKPESLIVNNRVVAGFHLGTLILTNRNKVIEALNEIYTLLKDCKIKPNIHAIMPVEQIVDGTKILAERRNIGKVLLSFM